MELGIVFLGTSAAVPTRYRGLPSIAVVHRGSIVLLDAGEGTQAALTRAGLSPLRVEAIFITHLHGDHFFGLPGLLQSMGMLGRKTPLLVAGPRGLYGFLREAFRASRWLPGFPLYVAELEPGEKLVLPSGLEVESFPVSHTIPAMGYRLVEPRRKPRINIEKARRLGIEPGPLLAKLQRGEPVTVAGRIVRPEEVVEEQPRAVIVYTGDTRPCPTVVEAARNATVLIHDATFTSSMAREAYEQGHSTARDAARAASTADARLLVLFHISARYETPDPLLAEARIHHDNVVAAEDYLKIPIRP
ncbi:ribonuclease Z [Hyperthermus butylicus]|uniref:Ribonuclease Z n=1 Tax=Hyperthermus butylicus (strain DSM 5456 / JCM 9403 / PLM1-5) TaxID=415426 RepID=A2BKK6_HYPBU|nr:ribonuclease Z [Hyperthermus butylicus]ABM80517.1 Metal-dependent hydrolase of beta lactamase, ElaC [Hyperthermus butylicus DSM 5456]